MSVSLVSQVFNADDGSYNRAYGVVVFFHREARDGPYIHYDIYQIPRVFKKDNERRKKFVIKHHTVFFKKEIDFLVQLN